MTSISLTAGDERRKGLHWTALTIIVVLSSWLFLLIYYGVQPLAENWSYEDRVLFGGLAAMMVSSVIYLAAHEKGQRRSNSLLLRSLHSAVEELNRRVEQLNALCDTSAELTGTLDLERISELVVSALVDQVRANASCLVLLDESTGEPIVSQRAGDGEPLDLEAAKELANLAARRQNGVLVPADSDMLGRQLGSWQKVKSAICAPLRSSRGMKGALDARRDSHRESFTVDDLNLLTTLANMASKAIENAQLHQELRRSYMAAVEVLINSLEARDHYTALHGQRVTELALAIGTNMGLAEERLTDIRTIGPLHDLGKVGIKDEVLLKAGELNEQERQAMCRHPVMAESILWPLRPSPEAMLMIRHHHERWDGQGYPDGLREEEIPLLARILAVADAYDAQVTARPYRAPLSGRQAMDRIVEQAGKQFDPNVIRAFQNVLLSYH